MEFRRVMTPIIISLFQLVCEVLLLGAKVTLGQIFPSIRRMPISLTCRGNFCQRECIIHFLLWALFLPAGTSQAVPSPSQFWSMIHSRHLNLTMCTKPDSRLSTPLHTPIPQGPGVP